MKSFLLIVSLLLGYVVAQTVSQNYVKASQLLEEYKFVEAYNEIRIAEKYDPDNPIMLQLKGRILIKLRHEKQAMEAVNRAVELAEKKSFFYGSKAIVHSEIGEWDSTAFYFKKALEGKGLYRSDSIAAYGIWATTEIERRNFVVGDSLLQLCYQMDSTSLDLLNNYAFMYLKTGEYKRANFYLEKALLLDSTASVVLQNLGYCYQELGEYEKSNEYLNQVIRNYPREASLPYNNRGYNKLQLGDLEGAMDDVNTSVKMDYTNSYAYRNRALIWLAKGEKDKACEDFEKAIRFGFTVRYGDEVEKLQAQHCE